MFGDYNPYRQPLFGDWLAMPSRGEDPDKHPGMVFLNGRALYEVTSLEDTFAPRYRDHVKDYVTDVACAIDDRDDPMRMVRPGRGRPYGAVREFPWRRSQ